MKRFLVIGIIFLFLCCNISFTTLSDDNSGNLNGKTLYVGGSGEGNYKRIQDAIDNASDGDTVFVYSGTYYGTINVHKSITLQGEDKHSTIIDGNLTTLSLITIKKDNTQILGFTIRNATYENPINFGAGIFIESSNNVISDNIITDVYYGIYSRDTYDDNYISNCIISNCTIRRTNTGITLWGGSANNIYNNRLLNNNVGIQLRGAWFNTISNNIFENNNGGITFYYWYMDGGSSFNKITYNSFIDNGCGIGIEGGDTNSNLISNNNFIDNSKSLRFFYPITPNINIIIRNYWDRPRLLPKLIFGFRVFILPFPWALIDWFPAKEPYGIPIPEVLR
jgi:nitrous oxidase accessory protein